jgi:magnesium chelatase subunit D
MMEEDDVTMDDYLFPFSAIVDQRHMKMALVLNAINPNIGGVLIKGTSGTAKSTAARGMAALLPPIEVVSDCHFNCSPTDEMAQCDRCRERVSKGEKLPVTIKPRSFVDLPLNATEDRVAGTIDVTRALKEGIKALEPGLLAKANRGILYIDEINLLDDHITDILLDAAALGVNVVEREGISISHPARFILIGTMNPEEGELRPQIADRIGLQVENQALKDQRLRAEVMKRREAFLRNPKRFISQYQGEQHRLRSSIEQATRLLLSVSVAERLYEAVASLVLKMGVESHRADITILECAKAMAAFNGRTYVNASDMLEAATLALGHRLPHDPFTPVELDTRELQRHLEEILGEPVPISTNEEPKEEGNAKGAAVTFIEQPEIEEMSLENEGTAARHLRRVQSALGKRDMEVIGEGKGKYIRPKFFEGNVSNIAMDATLRAAVCRTAVHGSLFEVTLQDLREKTKRHRSHYVIAFVVDNSWSVHVGVTLEKAKGVAFDLLCDARLYKDKVGLVAFKQGRPAEAFVCLPFTNNYVAAAKRLKEIPVCGSTPLPDGLRKALDMLRLYGIKYHDAISTIVVISDGKPNVSILLSEDPYEEMFELCHVLRRRGMLSFFIDVTTGHKDQENLCRKMADLSGGVYVPATIG